MSLEDALKKLSDAHGSKALSTAFGKLHGEVTRARRAAKAQLGPLASTFIEAMRIWDVQKKDGVSEADRVDGLSKSLRAAWPQAPPQEAWTYQYACERCSGYGLETLTCPGDATCGRRKPHLAHDYGTPCWCDAGKRFRAPAKPNPEDFSAAGKTPKRSGFAKVGR